MVRKILDGLAVASFVLTAGIIGGGFFGYFWITNEKTQEKLKQQLVEQVTKSIKLPSLSSPALPTAQPPQGLSIPKF